MENIEIGNRIRETRKKRNMSMKELGKRVNLHESTISRYEKGEIQALDIEKLKEFAKALDVSSSYLIGWEEKKEEHHEGSSLAEKVGGRITYIRNKRGMSIEELAQKTGITPQKLLDMENGVNHDFDMQLMYKFCGVLDVDTSYFIDITEPVDDIGKNIKAFREAQNLTMSEVANEMHIDVEEYKKIENGKKISYDFLDRLAQVFNINVAMLIGLDFHSRHNESTLKTAINVLKRSKRWNEEVGETLFTDAEMDELINYAKFIISKRKDGK